MTGVRSPSTRPGLGAPVTRGGFPHSEIRGSTLVRSSPRLIAAYHVLHRLSAPRHPPDALQALDRSLARCPCGRPRRAAHAHGLERPVSFSGSVASTRARGQRPPKGPNRSSLFTMSMNTPSRQRTCAAATGEIILDGPRHPRHRLVEPDGIEPTTSCLQSRRSPN